MIGLRIKQSRKSKGLSQAELACKLGLKTQSIQQWESGRTEPRFARLEQLADTLNVTIAWLHGLDPENHQPQDHLLELQRQYKELAKNASSNALQKLEQMGWLSISRKDIPIDAMADIISNEIERSIKGLNL